MKELNLAILKTDGEYHAAMARLETLFGTAKKGTTEGDEFELLSLLISDWEQRNVVIEKPTDPISLIRFAMDAREMSVLDLQPLMQKNRAYEVLNKKRALSLRMIRWFHENLQLPLDVLTMPYPLDGKAIRS